MAIQQRAKTSAARPRKGRKAATAALLLTVAADDPAAQAVHVAKELLESTVVGRHDDVDQDEDQSE